MFAFLLMSIAAASATQSQDLSAKAKLKSSFAGLLNANDYPMEAVLYGIEGATTVEMTIGTDGRVSACEVIESTGSSILDQRTCDVLRERARFVPGKGSDGNPIQDTYVQRVRWLLPDFGTENVGKVFWKALFDSQGRAIDCAMTVGRAKRSTDCKKVGAVIQANWAMMVPGPPPRATTVGFVEQLRPGGGEPIEPATEKDGLVLAHDSRELEIHSDGSFGKCAFQLTQPVDAKRRCAPPPGMKSFAGRKGDASMPAIRLARTVWTAKP